MNLSTVCYGLLFGGLLVLGTPSDFAPAQSPSVAGITLGMKRQEVSAILGGPDVQQQSLGMRFWEYRTRGLTVIWRDDLVGVSAIVVRKRAAGEIRGVRVGDTARAISDKWGTPVRVRSTGRFLDFAGDGWTLSAEIAKGKAIEITLLAAR